MVNRRSIPRRGAECVLTALLLASLPACGGLRTVEGRDAALIYGFFDVPESVGDANCVGIIQDERAGIGMRHGCMATSGEGLFFVENAAPGRYVIHGFYVDDVSHSLGPAAKPFLVAPGSMHYVGTFRYRRIVEPGVLRAGRFSLTPASHPTHAQVLKKLLGQVSDPRWKRRIAARLRELGAGE